MELPAPHVCGHIFRVSAHSFDLSWQTRSDLVVSSYPNAKQLLKSNCVACSSLLDTEKRHEQGSNSIALCPVGIYHGRHALRTLRVSASCFDVSPPPPSFRRFVAVFVMRRVNWAMNWTWTSVTSHKQVGG